jgi:twitching motility protein PilT
MKKAVMDRLLAHAVKHGASDIHFLVGNRPSFRIDGVLRPLKHAVLEPADTMRVGINLLGEAAKEQLTEAQEHDASYSLDGAARFRVNIFRQRGSLCAILRVISSAVPTIDELALPERIRQLAEEERGLVLVTGATGSGKSTTLAAMIHHINLNRAAHILTIEDPIEFLHRNKKASVSQREVGPDTRNFTTALRAALRQDPDVIMVGEMRDAETIDVALKAAETGHMVFSTVHTTDAAKTIGRLVGVFPAEEQHSVRLRLSETLKGIVSQRLLPRADGAGRVVVPEIMVTTKTIQECIREPTKTGEITDVIEKSRDQYGMQSFDQELSRLYKAGVIDLEVAKSAASNIADFERALNFGNEAFDPNEAGEDEDDSEKEEPLELSSEVD